MTIWTSGEEHTVLELLDRRLESEPDAAYLDVCGHTATAAEVASVANRLANAYGELGVRPGERVATLIENSAEAMFAWWGARRLGRRAL